MTQCRLLESNKKVQREREKKLKAIFKKIRTIIKKVQLRYKYMFMKYIIKEKENGNVTLKLFTNQIIK